ncbi:PLP-dependent transferase [Basidiobolus meristosporus CBS 931.73]|uniref:alanine--glyoxylate transaminase n=1 Tax=Basidiobolus meristosporus CBS 931.73 TaxID=1314790 RepID=A0A1Y1Y1M6_9FUNG|nr:PLP-dependent transferase [Basidiobolus meristosporus CBS 931.73]|eukprot:ORX91795.1 PLP-dependent transferase [Basidiobolus meristosporus CBS 931.73]
MSTQAVATEALDAVRALSTNRNLCMIPGPIEFHEEVLEAMKVGATSHVDPKFINIFGESLELFRKVLFSKEGQPFIITASGTLGWDMVAANLIEKDENVLVVSNGYFGDNFGECLKNYGAQVQYLPSEFGSRPTLQKIEQALNEKKYKVITLTHVDTSTGVLADIEGVAKLVRQKFPNTLVVVDGVCSVGCENIKMDDWGVDVVLTGSQKALGAPPGLSLLVASQRAISVFEKRTTPPSSYYAGWNRWIPIMRNYEARKASYFATPAVQNVMALNVALKRLEAFGIENNFAKHREVSDSFKDTIESWGLQLVPVSRDVAAHAMTAVYYPDNVTAADFLPKIAARGVTIAGGIHKENASKYFRIGHMGISVVEPQRQHITRVLDVVKESLSECGYKI